MAKGHRRYLLLYLHEERVVFDPEVILHKFLKNLVCGHMVDTGVGFKPFDFDVEIFEDARPISHMFKFIACTPMLLAEDLFGSQLLENIHQ